MYIKQGLLRNARLWEIAVIGFCFPAAANAQIAIDLNVGMDAHSNVDLRPNDEKSDVARTAGVGVKYEHRDDGRFEADLGYSALYEDYLHNIEDDRAVLNGQATGTWHIAPRLLDGIFSHQISTDLANRRQTATANNQDQRSVITAGLDGFLNFSAVDSLVLSPRYVDVSFKDNEQSDSQREEFTARWSHRLRTVSSLDLSATYADATFDDPQNDYDTTSVMLSYHTTLSHLTYQIGLGVNQISRDQGDDVDGSMARMSVDYRNENNQSFGAAFVHQLTDSSLGLSGVGLSTPNLNPNDSNFDQVDIVEIDQIDMHLINPINTTSQVSLGVGYTKSNYQDTPRDENLWYARAGYAYTMNSRWSVDFSAAYENTEVIDAPQREYDDTTFEIGTSYHPSRPVEVRFSIGQEKRTSDAPTDEYEDVYAAIHFKYQLL
jgi:hypothetical protein